MDPALLELMSKGDARDSLEAIIRLEDGERDLPPRAHEIARFGQIRTVRLARRDIRRVWQHRAVASLKAPRLLQLERPPSPHGPVGAESRSRRAKGLRQTGRGVVVGVIDWGFDVAHPAFLDRNGNSRVRAIWDQRDRPPPAPGDRPQPYGYGRVLLRRDIDRAMASGHPFRALSYHPGDTDVGLGAHGTHVADIAAGSRRPGGGGVAPGADLVFVHLASQPLDGLANLGDSVRILEAVDFISRVAGNDPLVINMSIGRHGGPHTALTLVERALDAFVSARPDTQIIQSGGNYYLARAHAAGQLAPGRSRSLEWRISATGPTANELEIWYSNRDEFGIEISAPGQTRPIHVRLGEAKMLHDRRGDEIGRIYHRAFDPNSPDHHVDIFLERNSPAGVWTVRLTGKKVSDGRYNAWIERDRAGRRGQSGFLGPDVSKSGTIGSICNGFKTIAVGAADDRLPITLPARFASAGPTRDGRTKPDLVAPGVQIAGARSAPRGAETSADRVTRMSGASQAAPYVAGVTALCLEAAGGGLSAHDLRQAIIGTAEPVRAGARSRNQLGAGLVQPTKAIAAAQAIADARERSERHEQPA